jgi:GcrA cell cycle regulator
MSKRKSPWTPALDVTLHKLFATNMTANAIARELGNGLTKNAVIGRAHRLKLPSKKRPSAAPVEKTERASGRPRDRVVHIFNGANIAPLKTDGFKAGFFGQGVSLLAVRPDQCRWPLDGLGLDGKPRCCGEKIIEGTSYCARHCRAAFQVMPNGLQLPEAA